ncbi:MAG: hypothetical protein ACJAYU_000545 [Bradymonadia bacterium]
MEPEPLLQHRKVAFALLGLASLLVLIPATGYWSAYTPLADDASSHITTIGTLASRIQTGAGWWSTDYNIGFPMALYYQPLPHVLSAITTLPFGGAPAADETYKFWLIFMLAVQPWAIYLGLHRMGLDRWTAALAGFLAVFLPNGITFGYHAWATLKVGLYTQAWGNVALPLALGELGRIARGKGRVSTTMAACAFTASTHMFYAIALVVPTLLFVLIGRAGRKSILQLGAAGIGAFAMLSGWLLPLVQTQAYMGGWPFGRASRVDGYGATEVFSRIGSGTLMDGERETTGLHLLLSGDLPILSALALFGIGVVLVRIARTRRAKATQTEATQGDTWTAAMFIAILTLWALVGTIGRASFEWIDLYPLHRNVQLFRYGSLLQFCGVVLAAIGLARVTTELEKTSRWLALLTAIALVALPVSRGMTQLNLGFRTIDHTTHFRPGPYFAAVQAMAEVPDGGRIYVGKRTELRGHYHSGLLAWTAQRPMAQSYGVGLHDSLQFYTLEYFYPDRFDAIHLADLFDFRWVLYGNGVFPTEEDLLEDPDAESAIAGLHPSEPVYSHNGYHLAQLPVSGHAVTLMREVERRSGSPRTERARIRSWMIGNGPVTRQTVVLEIDDSRDREALVGSPQRERPSVYPTGMGPVAGEIVQSSHVGSTFRSEVVLDEPALVVAKIGFHPFWNVLLDGQSVEPLFAYPGFLAVEVQPGRHEVAGYFQWPTYARVLFWMMPLPLLIAIAVERALKRRRWR